MTKIRLAVLFGGRSSEHSVSCVSAASLLGAVDRDRYDVIAIGIARDGRWVLASDDPASLATSGRELPSVDGSSGQAVVLPADPTAAGIVALAPTEATGLLGGIDVVFPLLHGCFGEDGTIQGLLEMAGVPYVGSGVFSSAAAMDKVHMKRLLHSAGLPVGPYVVVEDRDWATDRSEALERAGVLGMPVFVKPARGGSSIGISKVTTASDLESAIEAARSHDRKVVIEAAIEGREIECGVLETPDGLSTEASLPAEIRVLDESGFYDFDAKYLDDATELTVPAELSAETTAAVQEMALAAFAALDCAGLARVDFFLGADGSLTVNELNTMPGFTPVSMFPRMWAASGVDYPVLVDRLVRSALNRAGARQS